MIISLASFAQSAGRTDKSGVLSAGLSIRPLNPSQAEASSSRSSPKNSIYDNFSREITRRLKAAEKIKGQGQDQDAEPSILAQSLTGAMGEIEQIFSREAATEVMAKIITGTADGLTEDSLLKALQNGLAGLTRQDPNGTRLKRLTEALNKDLALALEPELAEQKVKSGQTVSLSFALARHFDTLSEPEADECLSDESSPATRANAYEDAYKMAGFDETGSWGLVDVVKPDEASAEELKEAAEAGVTKVVELTMAHIMEYGDGEGLFFGLARFLEKELQDKESAAFVEQGFFDSYDLLSDKYGASPKISALISQVYSKVAAEGDADKLALLEDYINTDFKKAINPILANIQQLNPDLLPGAEVGELQFKGLGGASLGGESDAFSLNWGYKDDSTYDKTVAKHFLQEDIRGVKAVQEKIIRLREDKWAQNWDATSEEEQLKRIGRNKEADEHDSDLRVSLAGKLNEERQLDKLEEAMTTRFGQLNESSLEEMEQYLKKNFDEETAEKLLEHTRWSNDLMSGLAGINQDIREYGGTDSQAEDFLNYLNSHLKSEVARIAADLGGLNFDGWQSLSGVEGELEAAFNFSGQDNPLKVTIMDPGNNAVGDEEADDKADHAERILQAYKPAGAPEVAQVLPRHMQWLKGTGYLINLKA